jgi:iron complex transport system permease protein
VLAILAAQVGLPLPWAFGAQEEAIVLVIRLPRVVLGLLVGGCLAVAGAVMQGVFRNPLADPGLVGVSAGAALAAVAVIVLGESLLGAWSATLGHYALPVAAFLGGLGTVALVYRVATVRFSTDVASLLLAGIAVNAIAGAGTGLLTYLADDQQLRTLTFWSLGSLGRATWPTVGTVVPLLLACLLLLRGTSRALNALVLGEAEAEHLGLDVQRVKRRLVVLVAVAVGAAVSVAGMVGFVGLVVPHLVRLVTGADHRYVVPGSLLLGGCLVLGADLVARLAVAPAELPLGIVAASLGGPFFLWLLLRRRHVLGA